MGDHCCSCEKCGETYATYLQHDECPHAWERIVAAAIMGSDGTVYSVPPPGRHHNVIASMGGKYRIDDDPKQGFVTSTGRFVERYEGKQIARREGQLLDRASPSPQLFSEDVW
jgi:hypothetical protein